jgi:ribosomal-protein-alanine N-acetyltransferase
MQSVLLEVRPSNTRAIAIYQRYGFVEIGRRRDYYPAAGDKREEAIVMRLPL